MFLLPQLINCYVQLYVRVFAKDIGMMATHADALLYETQYGHPQFRSEFEIETKEIDFFFQISILMRFVVFRAYLLEN